MSIKINHPKESLKPESGVLEIDAKGAIGLPSGLTVDRPLVSIRGHIRFAEEIVSPEYFDGAVWQTVPNKAYVDNEVTRATDAESALATRIDNVISNFDPAALDSLTEIVAAFQNADGSLIQSISDLSSASADSIAAEVTRATNAELALGVRVDVEHQNHIDGDEINATAISDEVSRATTAEGVLRDDLADEVDRATTAEGVLRDGLADEATTARAAELVLRDDLADEVDRATTAEGVLRDDLADEVGRATTAEGSINSTISNLTLNSLGDVLVQGPTNGQILSYDLTAGKFKSRSHSLTPIARVFTGDSITLEFDIVTSVDSVMQVVVYINGIQQAPYYSYVLVDGHLIVFDEAPDVGDRIQVSILQSGISTDRPRPIIENITYSTIGFYTTINVIASSVAHGTSAKIGGMPITRIDYPAPNNLQLMIETSKTSASNWTTPQDLILVDTNGNEYVYSNMIAALAEEVAPYWTDSISYIGTFGHGNPINFSLGISNATSIIIEPAYSGEASLPWLSISNNLLVGTAPTNSTPSRYEVKVVASNGSVNITKNYWLLVI